MSARPWISMDVNARLQAIMNCEFARNAGMKVISISKEEVKVEMNLDDKLNGFGTGHGGAVFSLADQAFALACNQGEFATVARSASIKYLKPAQGKLVAIAREEREDERSSFCRVLVYSGTELVAEFEGIGHKLKKDKG